MKAIWKFRVPLDLIAHPQDREQRFMIEMPVGARVIRVGLQNNAPVFWAEVDTLAEKRHRPFNLRASGFEYGYGEYIDQRPNQYLGSFVFFGTERVGHLFG